VTVIQQSLNILFNICVHQHLHDIDETLRKQELISALDVLLLKSTSTEKQQNTVSQMKNELSVAVKLRIIENIIVSFSKDLFKKKTSAELLLTENYQCISATLIEKTLISIMKVMKSLSHHDMKMMSEDFKSIHEKVIH